MSDLIFNSEKIDGILILKLGSLGDVVHTMPLVNILRMKYPDARIGWAVEKKCFSLIENHPSVDEVIVFERERSIKTIISFIKFICKIRDKKYDIIIDLQGNLKGGIITFLSGCRRRMGFKRGSSRVEAISTLFTNRKISENGSHIIERNIGFARELANINDTGCTENSQETGTNDSDISFKVQVKESAKRYVDDFLKSKNVYDKRLVIMHPGVTWETKRWPIENYAHLSNEIPKTFPGTAIMITAGPGEEELAEKCRNGDTIIANQMNLSQLTALLSKCELFIGSDTGPLHLAAALGKRVIGLYGPTDPARNGPYGERNFALQVEIPCSNCWRKKCRSIKCMKEIKVSDVMDKVTMCLGSSSGENMNS